MDIDGPPKVWSTFEAKKNNEAYRIKIQQITRDLMEPVVEHMTRYYLPREPMAAHGGLASDPVSLNDMQALWRKTMGGGASIVALLEEGGNERDHNIVGANITGISCQDDGEFEMREGQAYMNALKTAIAITKEGDLFKKYGVDKYLTAYGLSVHPDYHGLGIGLKLLESREYVCKAFGLQMTGTVFTAPTSQHLAKKAGFELVVEHDFKDYKVNGTVYFPNMSEKIMLMAKTYA